MNTDNDPFALPPEPPVVAESAAHEQLKANLDLALGVHRRAMSAELPNIPTADKRLMVESAHVTVRAALQTDSNALRARENNVLELVLWRVVFERIRRGLPVKDEDRERLRNAPRSRLEQAFSPRQMLQFDKMKWD